MKYPKEQNFESVNIYPSYYKILLLLFYPIRMLLNGVIFIFLATAYYPMRSQEIPPIKDIRNPVLLISALILSYYIFNGDLLGDINNEGKVAASILTFATSLVLIKLMNDGDAANL